MEVNTTSGALSAVVRNDGGENARAVTVSLDGSGADQFAIANSCGSTLRPGVADA